MDKSIYNTSHDIKDYFFLEHSVNVWYPLSIIK